MITNWRNIISPFCVWRGNDAKAYLILNHIDNSLRFGTKCWRLKRHPSRSVQPLNTTNLSSFMFLQMIPFNFIIDLAPRTFPGVVSFHFVTDVMIGQFCDEWYLCLCNCLDLTTFVHKAQMHAKTQQTCSETIEDYFNLNDVFTV